MPIRAGGMKCFFYLTLLWWHYYGDTITVVTLLRWHCVTTVMSVVRAVERFIVGPGRWGRREEGGGWGSNEMVVVVTGSDWCGVVLWYCGTVVLWYHGGTPRSSLHPVPVSVGQCWPAARPAISVLSLSLLSLHSPVSSLYTVGHPHQHTELDTSVLVSGGWAEELEI